MTVSTAANKGIRAIRVYLWWPSHVDPAFNQPSAISSMPFKDREPTEVYVLPLVSVEWSQFFLVRLSRYSIYLKHCSCLLCWMMHGQTINPRVQNINNLIAAADRQSLERARDLTDNMAADCQFLHHKCMQRHDPPPVNEDAGQQAAQPRRIAWMEKNFLYRFALNELRMTSRAFPTQTLF